MKKSKRLTALILAFMFTATLASMTASAEHYDTYTTVAEIPNEEGCTAAQGFDVGTTYAYSIKIQSSESAAIIYRTKMSDGTTELMTNGDDQSDYCDYLGHANDLGLTTVNGVSYMFVVTMQTGEMSLVKLKLDGTTYTKVGNYTISYYGKDMSMSGVKIIGKDSNNINFLFKTGVAYYKGALPLTADSGTISLTIGFTLNTADALVNGKTVDGITAYANQGFGYFNDTVYHPVTQGDQSIILVYRDVSNASGTIYADDKLSISFEPEECRSFEVEGCGFSPDGRLWFSTNLVDTTGAAHDGVHYINKYSTWSNTNPVAGTTTVDATPSTSNVLIDGKETPFESYNINGSNYFKLRDIAMALKGSEKQFDLTWDDSKRTIAMNFEQDYTPAGGELISSVNPTAKKVKAGVSSIIINGFEGKLNSYNIGGNNYFMLKDLGKILNCSIKWDGVNKQIQLDTFSGYSDSALN